MKQIDDKLDDHFEYPLNDALWRQLWYSQFSFQIYSKLDEGLTYPDYDLLLADETLRKEQDGND